MQASHSRCRDTRQASVRRLEDAVANILHRHRYLAAATQELAEFLDEEVEQRAQDRLTELREQLEFEFDAREMQARVVDVHRGGQSECWLVVYSNGHIELHTENDGYRFMRRGPEAQDRLIDMAEVEALGRRHCKDLVAAVNAALTEMASA
jgi:hypothetical protein